MGGNDDLPPDSHTRLLTTTGGTNMLSVTYLKDTVNDLPIWIVYVNGTRICTVTKLTDAVRLRDKLVAAYVTTIAA